MLKLAIGGILGIVTIIGGYFGYTQQTSDDTSLGTAVRTFTSEQLATSPVAGYVLSSLDGVTNAWIAMTGGGGGGGVGWATTTNNVVLYNTEGTGAIVLSSNDRQSTGTMAYLNVSGGLSADWFLATNTASSSLFTGGMRATASSTISSLTVTTGTTTNGTSTTFRTTTLGVGSDYLTDITGAGLQITGNALTLNATGDWTGTLDGFEGATLAQTNWLFDGSRLSPSTTVGIGVFASSTIGDGTATGGLTISGSGTTTGTSTMHNLVVGGHGQTLQAGMTEPSAFVNASTSGRSGMILQNYGTGTAPEYRFIVGDPYSASGLEYIGFGLTNSGATSGGALQSLQKTDLAYVISNSGRDLLVTAGGGATAGNLYLGAGANTLPVFKLDGSTNRVGINLATTTTPTSTLSVNGDIYYANSIATGTATSVNMIATSILRAPYGTAPSVVTNGDIGIDSTSNQVKYKTNGSTYVLGNGTTTASFTYATTTTWTGTTTVPLGPAPWGETWSAVRCFTDTGTVNVDFGDGTNFMNATTTGAFNPAPRHTLTSNNTFTSGETRYARLGTPASSPTSVSCTVYKSITAD